MLPRTKVPTPMSSDLDDGGLLRKGPCDAPWPMVSCLALAGSFAPCGSNHSIPLISHRPSFGLQYRALRNGEPLMSNYCNETQIYDAHVINLYQWVCGRYFVGVKVAEKATAV